MFDVISYLESRHIKYHTEGRNVSSGWVNITCPFCSDKSNHLGINLTSGVHNCWKCGHKGGPAALIMALEFCSYGKAKSIAASFYDVSVKKVTPPRKIPSTVKLPQPLLPHLPRAHRNYLTARGFDPDRVISHYDICACANIGVYRQRIIIPIYFEGQLVNYVARDITDTFSRRYLMPPNRDIRMRRDHLLYNIDFISDTVVIVEGIFDMWRIGPPAVASFGTRITDEQCLLLYQKNVKHAFVLFDADSAQTYGKKIAKKLGYIIPHVENIIISEGDPDSYFLKHPKELHSFLRIVKHYHI